MNFYLVILTCKKILFSPQKKKKKNLDITDFQNIGNLHSHTEAVLHAITSSAHRLAYPNTYMCQTEVKYLITHMLSVGENETGGDLFLSFSSPVEHRLLFPRQQKQKGKISRESRVVMLKIFIFFFFFSLIICWSAKEENDSVFDAFQNAFQNILLITNIN